MVEVSAEVWRSTDLAGIVRISSATDVAVTIRRDDVTGGVAAAGDVLIAGAVVAAGGVATVEALTIL